jgi:hypothetical protein
VVIKRSSAREVAGLLENLRTGDAAARETAVARLSVIGTRAVEGLIGVATSEAPSAVRAAAVSALEATGDPRAIDPAFALLEHEDKALALAAAAVLRRALDSPRGNQVLDGLAARALDTEAPERARLAALEALQGLSPKMVAPMWRKLKNDPSAAVRAAVAGTGPLPEIDPGSGLQAASTGEWPDDPETLRRWLGADIGQVPLTVLHKLVEGLRTREAGTADPAERIAWMTARAAVHRVLADRGSRVALYDLRETIESGVAAPVEMLSALAAVGDRSCLEPIAAAYARLASAPAAEGAGAAAGSGTDPRAWWRQHLATTFRAIAAREKLTERQAEARRIRARWPDVALELIGLQKRG